MDLIERLMKILGTGGPWAFVAINFAVIVYLYKEIQNQQKWFYEQLIRLSNEHTSASVTLNGAIAALKDVIVAHFGNK